MLPKTLKSNLILDIPCPNPTAHGGSETRRAITLHKQLYIIAVPDISEEGPTQPQSGSEDHCSSYSFLSLSVHSRFYSSKIYLLHSLQGASQHCVGPENQGEREQLNLIFLTLHMGRFKSDKKCFCSPQNLTSRKTIWFQIFSFAIKPLLFFSILCMFIYKYMCFHVHISVFGTYREAQKHIGFLSSFTKMLISYKEVSYHKSGFSAFI